MHSHIKFGIPTSKNIGDMHRTRSGTDGQTDIVVTIKTKSEVRLKVTVTRKFYATLFHPKMYPHTKFGIPTSKNIGDMHRTRSVTDGQCDYYMPPKVPLGHKNMTIPNIKALGLMVSDKKIFPCFSLSIRQCTTCDHWSRDIFGPGL